MVTGTADLASALAVLEAEGIGLTRTLRILLFAQDVSLPEPLVSGFRSLCAHALPRAELIVLRFADGPGRARAISALPPLPPGQKVVVGNQVQSPHNRALYAALAPDLMLVYDNGLSSYGPHPPAAVEALRAALPGTTFRCRLAHADRLGVPPYLTALTPIQTPADAARRAYARLGPGAAPRLGTEAGQPDLLVLGTGFARTGLIPESEEIALHLALFDAIRRAHGGRLLFKPHPRAAPGLANGCAAAGIALLDSPLPVECHVAGPHGRAFSFSSTALMTLADLFDWPTHRMAHPAMEAIFNARPQLAMIREIPAASDIALP